MTSDALRWSLAVLCSTGVFAQVMALTMHWDILTPRARRVSAAAAPFLAAITASTWYSVHSTFPPNPVLPYVVATAFLFDLAVLYRLPSGR